MFPRIVELGPITLHSYGLLLATAFLLAITVMARLAEQEGVSRNRAWDMGFVIIVSAIFGAKILLILSDLEDFLARPSRLISLEFWQAGGVYYGGLIGAIVGAALYVGKSPDLKFWTIADAAAPAIALGQSIGRLGCFAAGCDYGKPTDLPWAVTFTSEYAHRFVGVPIEIPLHPSQIYESMITFLLFLALLWVYRKRHFSGQVFACYLFFYGVARFGLEFFRGDLDRGFVLGGLFSTSQFISLLIVPVSIVIYFYGRRRFPQPSRA
jgi:phosphatidylglycerol---prolipoprotein diacylglyceryl transferase